MRNFRLQLNLCYCCLSFFLNFQILTKPKQFVKYRVTIHTNYELILTFHYSERHYFGADKLFWNLMYRKYRTCSMSSIYSLKLTLLIKKLPFFAINSLRPLTLIHRIEISTFLRCFLSQSRNFRISKDILSLCL